jgi:hypothetical protein
VSEQIGFVLLAGVFGLMVGAIVASRRRPFSSIGGRPNERDAAIDGVQARLEVQAAEMRRLADAATARDATGEHLREGLEAARRAVL